MHKKWTYDMDSILRNMVAAKGTHTTIAAQLGVTPNAVAGRMNRLGLRSRNPIGNRNNGRHISRNNDNSSPPETKLIVRKNRAQVIEKIKDKKFAMHGEAFGTPVLPADIQPHQCHFPVGDPLKPEFRYCGAPRHKRDYCEGHYNLAYYSLRMRDVSINE